jgi:hypothetical protein
MCAHAYHFCGFALGQQQFFYLAQKSPRLILKDIGTPGWGDQKSKPPTCFFNA